MNQGTASTRAAAEPSLFARAAKIVLVLSVCFALIAGPVYSSQGSMGLVAVAIAAATCVLAHLGAAAVAQIFTASGSFVTGTLLGMGLRMAFPLVFAMVVYSQGGPLVAAGLIYYLIAFYLVALAAETWLTVNQIKSSQAGAGAMASKGM